jgi:hypothetical protein
MTNEERREKLNALRTETAQLDKAGDLTAGEAPISPRTKLPEDHPESQEVERIRYEMQQSLCGRVTTEAETEEAGDKQEEKKPSS